MYWDIGQTLSHNCLMNSIVGIRGVGKTYGFKKWAVKDFLKNGNQFIYLRRYKNELNDLDNFFADIIRNEEFPETKLEVKGKKFYINDKLAGFAVILSTSRMKKSVSYPLVTKIGFDEFIIEKGVIHYLPDEVKTFSEFYLTVSRYRPVIVFLMANSITMTNPYFIHWNLALPYGSNFFKRGEFLLQLVDNPEFMEHATSTRVGKMFIEADPDYSDYAMKNKFMLDNKNFVEKKTEKARHNFSFKYNGETYGIWVDYFAGKMFVSTQVDPSCSLVYAVTTNDHCPNTMLLKQMNRASMFKTFIEYYKLGNVRFESIKVKNICADVIKLTMR